jgi:hypothetical protein
MLMSYHYGTDISLADSKHDISLCAGVKFQRFGGKDDQRCSSKPGFMGADTLLAIDVAEMMDGLRAEKEGINYG